MMIDLPLDLIFRDLFYRLPEFAGGNDVFLKLEGFNVTGSIKTPSRSSKTWNNAVLLSRTKPSLSNCRREISVWR